MSDRPTEPPFHGQVLPPWPRVSPRHGSVVLREFGDADTSFAMELAQDPYAPLIGTLPAHASAEEAGAWIGRQRGRDAEGRDFSFAIADGGSGAAVGAIGLWLRNLVAGLSPRRAFAWTIPQLYRVEAYVEPWNVGSCAP